MNQLTEMHISCPYCGESIEVLIDQSVADQQYIEDCQVCCRPIEFEIWQDVQGDFQLNIKHENE